MSRSQKSKDADRTDPINVMIFKRYQADKKRDHSCAQEIKQKDQEDLEKALALVEAKLGSYDDRPLNNH